MEDCNPKFTSVDKVPWYKDEVGDPFREAWEYISVLGMMLYLVGSTRPHIVYAVRQYARFSHNSKRWHDVGLRNIVGYLKETKDKCRILIPYPKN